MKPEHDTRRTLIRKWMSLPKEKRQTEDQARQFAKEAAEQNPFRCAGDKQQKIMGWLRRRTGRS